MRHTHYYYISLLPYCPVIRPPQAPIRALIAPITPNADVAAPRANVPTKVATYIIMPKLEAGIGLLEFYNAVFFKINLNLKDFTIFPQIKKMCHLELRQQTALNVFPVLHEEAHVFPLVCPVERRVSDGAGGLAQPAEVP